jgi:NADH-quinone oxidoreductase subunit L
MLDGLSLTMLGVVTGVGFLIHVFASWYMRGEEGYSRFFAYTNLFIASMVFLVLADNLLFLYLGWEGVGLCSYLLIGFYYRTDPKPTARGDQGLRGHPRRRRVPRHRAVHPALPTSSAP